MAEITISTDGTITGTKLMVDGKDVTKKERVVGIEVYARAPYKSSYSGDTIKGMAAVSYETVTDDGKVERKSYGTTETAFGSGIGQKIKNEDSVVRFIGAEVDKKVSDLVDSIVSHCEETKTKCPDRETLLSRSLDSLKDKAQDLGISVEDTNDDSSEEEESSEDDAEDDLAIDDAKKEYYAVKASETSGDEPKYPINNCSDVSDAWKLRSHGKGLKISQQQLENRIKRRAKALGCKVPGSSEDSCCGEDNVSKTKTGRTSTDKGHSHAYSIDALGLGTTSVANEHKHSIKNKIVQPAMGHIHKI